MVKTLNPVCEGQGQCNRFKVKVNGKGHGQGQCYRVKVTLTKRSHRKAYIGSIHDLSPTNHNFELRYFICFKWTDERTYIRTDLLEFIRRGPI